MASIKSQSVIFIWIFKNIFWNGTFQTPQPAA